MRSFKASNGTLFNYNSDLSGDIIVRDSDGLGVEHSIPGEDLAEFIWECLEKPRRIAELEATDWREN